MKKIACVSKEPIFPFLSLFVPVVWNLNIHTLSMQYSYSNYALNRTKHTSFKIDGKLGIRWDFFFRL